MDFRLYSDIIANATKKVAATFLSIGIALLGLCVLLFVFKIVFIIIAVAILAAVGMWCIGTAIRIFVTIGRGSSASSPEEPYRENVRIHNRP